MDPLDRQNRIRALDLAVETHPRDGQTDAVLATATKFLAWLRRPTPAAKLTLHISAPIPK